MKLCEVSEQKYCLAYNDKREHNQSFFLSKINFNSLYLWKYIFIIPKGQSASFIFVLIIKKSFIFVLFLHCYTERDFEKDKIFGQRPVMKGPNLTLWSVTDFNLIWVCAEFRFGVDFCGGRVLSLRVRLLGFFDGLVWEANAIWGGFGRLLGCFCWSEKKKSEWAPCRGLALMISCSPPLLLAILTVLSLFLFSLWVCVSMCLKIGFWSQKC